VVLGIIFVIIGVVIFISNLINDIGTIQQQTVQYLGFIWASLFVVGGFIMITIQKRPNNRDLPSEKHNEELKEDYVSDDKWRCGGCDTVNDIYIVSCKKCGKPLKKENEETKKEPQTANEIIDIVRSRN
jgi:membrane-bound ClpP family serine protease